jgi:hypothetical protein
MIRGSIKNMTEADWRDHYRHPDNFFTLFKDYRQLRDADQRRELSSAEEAQKRVIEEMIDSKLA